MNFSCSTLSLRRLGILGIVAFFILAASANLQAVAAPTEIAGLKTTVTLDHEKYRAAKRLCLALLHSLRAQHKLPAAELVTALHDCSYGNFDQVMHRLDAVPTEKSEIHHGHNGPELVDSWEVDIRDTHEKMQALAQEEKQ